ncbi:Fc.00g067790.m01.CDS01 [Cosmosporella sp. VM-42]
MARSRSSNLAFILAMLFGILLCVFAASVSASESPSASPSPSAEVDLICHTSNPDECYPRVFQAADEFQIVHDDQELPHGLHVRLNINTGLKEAKINVPDEVNPSLEGLPVDQAVLVVDPEQADAPNIPKGAPEYDTVGRIKEPQEPEENYAGKPFFEAMKILKKGAPGLDEAVDVALEGMEELSHDLYYGLKITEDPAVVKGLFCMMANQHIPIVDGGFTPRDQQAAAILAGALQNHPSALKEVAKQWDNLMAYKCPKTGKPLSEGFYARFVPYRMLDGAGAKIAAGRAKAKVAAINGLIKSDTIRAEFLKNDGMRRLLEVMLPESQDWATAQRKVGQTVLDTFLDEDMGAKTGQWPRTAKASDATCENFESQTDEGCWDYHVERIMKANKWDKDHWSKDLSKRLAKARRDEKAPPHVEL